MQFAGYGEHCWGFTACDGPGWVKRVVGGVERQFFDYVARGAPFGPDDGTVAPWVVLASLPFAPEIVLPTVRSLAAVGLGGQHRPYGFRCSFNRTFRVDGSPTGWWVTPYQFGIDQGPVVLMIENYRAGLIWDLMRRCPPLVTGLRRAGFTGSPLTDAHVGERGDPAADAPVDQVAGGGEQQEVPGKPDVPAGGAHPGDIPGKVQRLRAGPHQLAGQAREEPLHDSVAAFQQDVRVPALRRPLPGGRGLGEAVALQQRDAVEVVGQDPGRKQPGQAAADDHGVMATRNGQATRSVKMMSRAHTILLIPL
jgi:hypothetical protein